MNTIFKLAAIVLCASLTACDYTEKVAINADGSGAWTMIVEMPEEFGGGVTEFNGAEEMPKHTIIRFSDFIDSEESANFTPEQRAGMEKLRPFSMRIQEMGENFRYSFFTDFKSVSHLQGLMDGLGSMRDDFSDGNEMGAFMDLPGSEHARLTYSFDGKTFSRISVVAEDVDHTQYLEELGGDLEFLEASTYNIHYSFPRPIRSVSIPGAVISADKHSFTAKVSAADIARDPTVLDFEVVLE